MSLYDDYLISKGAKCPVCRGKLAFIQSSAAPPMDGMGGQLILCEICASLVIANEDLTQLRPMTQSEKQALRDHPYALRFRTVQEELAYQLGGSD